MKIEVSCRINAAREKVFELFSDLNNLASHVDAIKRVEVLTPGKIGAGTEFRETRVMFGREATETMKVTEFVPPERLVEEARSDGVHYTSIWTFSEADGATTVTIRFSGEATSLKGKVVKFFFSLMTGTMKKAFLSDMNDLKNVLEG